MCYSQYFMVSYGKDPRQMFNKSRLSMETGLILGYDIKMGKHLGLNTQLGLETIVDNGDKTQMRYRAGTASILLNRKFYVMAKESAWVYVYGGAELAYGITSTIVTSDYSLSYQSFPKYEQDLYSGTITAPMYWTPGSLPLNRFDYRGSIGIGFNVLGAIGFDLNYVHGFNPIFILPEGSNVYASFFRIRICIGYSKRLFEELNKSNKRNLFFKSDRDF